MEELWKLHQLFTTSDVSLWSHIALLNIFSAAHRFTAYSLRGEMSLLSFPGCQSHWRRRAKPMALFGVCGRDASGLKSTPMLNDHSNGGATPTSLPALRPPLKAFIVVPDIPYTSSIWHTGVHCESGALWHKHLSFTRITETPAALTKRHYLKPLEWERVAGTTQCWMGGIRQFYFQQFKSKSGTCKRIITEGLFRIAA